MARLLEANANWVMNEFFTVDVKYVEVNGRIVIGELRVRPWERERLPQGGITSRTLRLVPFDKMLRFDTINGPLNDSLPTAEAVEFIKREIAKGRGQERTEDFYGGVVTVYLWALQVAPRRPIVHGAEFLRKNGVDVSAAQFRSLVNLTRRHGLIAGSRPGSAGAEPTERLREWRKRVRAVQPDTGRTSDE